VFSYLFLGPLLTEKDLSAAHLSGGGNRIAISNPEMCDRVHREGQEVRARTVIIWTYLLGTIRFVTIFVLVMAAIILWFS
jgi:hypothetical protein